MYYLSFFHENVCCRYSLEVPQRGASNEYQQHVFMEKKKNFSIHWVEKSALSEAMLCLTISNHLPSPGNVGENNL